MNDPLASKPASAWHALSGAEVIAACGSHPDGLSVEEVARRRARFGANVLPRPKRPSLLVIFLRQFTNPLVYLLVAAGLVSLFIHDYGDAVLIFIVLLVNAVIGTFQEGRAESSAEALDLMIQNWAVVRRDGARHRVDSVDLVPGDIVYVGSGAAVPADLRLIECHGVEVDESLLTGESLPVSKSPASSFPEATPLADRGNMLHAGSTILKGRAAGVVVETGMRTEIGRIAEALVATEGAPPPLVVRLERFTRLVAIACVVLVVGIGVAQFLQGAGLVEVFVLAVALAVAAIPEGLPVGITVALAVGSHRMAARNVIVRALPAVEGLGACTMVLSDKTGTLTRNELSIHRIVLPDLSTIAIDGTDLSLGEALRDPDGKAAGPGAVAGVRRLMQSGALCNEASWQHTDNGYSLVGDTVDVAFLVLADRLGIGHEVLAGENPQVGAIPFEPQLRFAATFNRKNETLRSHVKGAAETVLPMCGGDLGTVAGIADRMAHDGYRVLAVAAGTVPDGTAAAAAALRDLEFIGLVGLIDPIRPEAPAAIRQCLRSGIDVRMVTGDHPATALTIGRELGIATQLDEVTTGAELAAVGDDRAAFDAIVADRKIFARIEPIQKLAIVEAARRAGHFVAVTGDGVNDAPALHAANIGVAMGRDGTDVARAASDLILTDDNFASIVNGIEEGRIAYDNLRKLVSLLVATGLGEIVLFLLCLAGGLPLPLFAVQLLWLNLVTNGIQHIALSFERGEPDILDRAPRPPDQRVFDRRMIEQVCLAGLFIGGAGYLFFAWAVRSGVGEVEARSALLLLMVLFENVHVFNSRSEVRSVFRVPIADNPLVVASVALALGIHIAATNAPGFGDLLHIAPIPTDLWLVVVPIALALIAVFEAYKRVRPRT